MNVLKGILALCTLVGVLYVGFWATKNFSYYFMYDSLVQETIAENVKEECLIVNKEK